MIGVSACTWKGFTIDSKGRTRQEELPQDQRSLHRKCRHHKWVGATTGRQNICQRPATPEDGGRSRPGATSSIRPDSTLRHWDIAILKECHILQDHQYHNFFAVHVNRSLARHAINSHFPNASGVRPPLNDTLDAHPVHIPTAQINSRPSHHERCQRPFSPLRADRLGRGGRNNHDRRSSV